LRASCNDLDAEKTAALAAVADLEATVPTDTGPGDVSLLGYLLQLRPQNHRLTRENPAPGCLVLLTGFGAR
jgi:hypothetical protein